PDATAKFYVDVFGLKQVGRIDNPNTSGYYLTDGEINLAILKFKNDKVAGVERGKDWSGIHHFGFQVDDLDDTSERLAAANAPRALRGEVAERVGEALAGQLQIPVRLGIRGLGAYRRLEVRDGLVEAPDVAERDAPVVLGVGAIRPQPHCLAEMPDCLLRPPL